MEEKKKINNKTAIIIIASIATLVILYFLFFVVDIVSYIKNYEYLQDAGARANELNVEIQNTINEIDNNRNEHEKRIENIHETYGY